jgi:hypothetical protein
MGDVVNSRDKRALIVGGCAIAGTVLMLRVLPWTVRSVSATLGDLRERATLVAHARSEVEDAAVLRDSVATITQALVALAPELLGGHSAPEAVADLSAQLNLAATRHQARLVESAAVPDTTRAGRLSQVSVRASLETDIRGLTGVLGALEAGSPTLTVRSVRVLAPDPVGAERKPEVLTVEITVAGWFLQGREGGTAHGS